METTTTTSPSGDVDTPTIGTAHRELLNQLLDTWSVPVLETLCIAPLRFNELRRAIPGVTQKSLTAVLRRLERNGIVERVVVSSRPVQIRYEITALGKTLREPIDALLDWTQQNADAVAKARAWFDDQDQE